MMNRFQRHAKSGVSAITGEDLNIVQTAIESTTKQFTDRDHLLSNILENVSLTGGIENWVEHGLGKTIRGWKITDIKTQALIWRVETSTADLEKYLPLGTTADATVNIEVFA